MSNDFKVTIRFEKAKSDIAKLKKILKDLETYETSTSNKDEAIRLWKAEFRKRLSEAGLNR